MLTSHDSTVRQQVEVWNRRLGDTLADYDSRRAISRLIALTGCEVSHGIRSRLQRELYLGLLGKSKVWCLGTCNES